MCALPFQVIDWYNVNIEVYIPVFLYALVAALAAKITKDLAAQNVDVASFLYEIPAKVASAFAPELVADAMLGALIIIIVFLYLRQGKNSVYLLDFATFKPPASWKVMFRRS